MASGCLIKRRDAAQAVHSRFGSQQPIGVLAFNSERYTLQSGFLTWLILEHFSFESTLLGPFEIHAQQHLGPVLRFSAPCAGMNRADGMAAIVFARQQHLGFSLGEVVLKTCKQRLEFVD